MSVADDLRVARALIEDRRHWTTGELARDANNNAVRCKDPAAVRWCAAGATMAVAGHRFAARNALYRAAPSDSVGHGGPVWVNDVLGHPAVLAMYDRAIELAEANQ